MGHAGVGSQRRQVEFLRGPARDQPQKRGEGGQAGHLQRLAHVPLDVGLGVARDPVVRRKVAVAYPRVAARPNHGPEFVVDGTARAYGEAANLLQAKGQEVQRGDPAGKGLADRFGQAKMLRSGEHEATGRGVLVHLALQVGEQARRPLHFVEDDGTGMPGQKAPRVGFGELANVQRLQADVVVAGEARPAKSRLPGLTRTGDGHDRHLTGRLEKTRFQRARDHCTDCKSFLQSGPAGRAAEPPPVSILRLRCR